MGLYHVTGLEPRGRICVDVEEHLRHAFDDFCDRILLVERTAGRTIRNIRAREVECPSEITAAAGIEFRTMVREGEHMFLEKLLEAKPCGFELSLAFFEPPLHNQ